MSNPYTYTSIFCKAPFSAKNSRILSDLPVSGGEVGKAKIRQKLVEKLSKTAKLL